MADLHTDPDLLALLERVRKIPITPQIARAQRRSYVVAEMGMGSDADEVAYALAVASGDQWEIARLDKEAQERMTRARLILDRLGY